LELLQHLLPDNQQIRLENWHLDTDNQHLIATVHSTQVKAKCPVCQAQNQRIHSRYERTLQDLTLAHYRVTLQVQVRKFFCDATSCIRRIFTERIPVVAAPWARKTVRLVQQLQNIGLALGGAAGSRLAHKQGYEVCGSTLLNHLKRLPLPSVKVPKVLGVDDFAFRRGRQYGTILVDLEQHRPIVLLADRKAETLKEWLVNHPGVEILSRDRSKTYRSGMTEGAPNALQVADRFHLVQNLTETLEKVFSSYSRELKAIDQHYRPATLAPEIAIVKAKPTSTMKAQTQFQATHERRIEQQKQIKQLHQQQWSQIAIAEAVGVSIRTVQRYLKLPNFPTAPTHRKSFGKSSVLDPYKSLLLAWWNDGIRQPKLLVSLLQQQGSGVACQSRTFSSKPGESE
jgi:transposase